jgi:DNA-directed RNA polymerase subunit K/omega
MTETGHYQLKKYNSEKNIGKALEEIAAGLIKVKVTTK